MIGEPTFGVARRGLALTFVNIRLFTHLSVEDNVRAPQQSDLLAANAAVARLRLASHRFTEASALSYRMQRWFKIARAMSTQPLVVLLDEPAAGMNHRESDVLLGDIWALAERHNCGVIIIDHDLRLCDRNQVLEAGHTIAVGAPQEIMVNPAVTAAYLDDLAPDLAAGEDLGHNNGER